MEIKKDGVIRILGGVIIIMLLTIIAFRKPNDMVPPPIHNSCKEDSLIAVINQLEIDIENEEDGWDKKERRYEDVIYEYEFGLEHLKNYRPEAYKEFHRIVGFKEKYNHETERENKQRLKTSKW